MAVVQNMMEEEIRSMQNLGRDVVQSFFVCIRMSQLYDSSNQAYQKPLGNFIKKLKEFLSNFGELRAVFAEGQIYINDMRLKGDVGSYEWVSELINYFTERGLGGVRIVSLPRREKVTDFLAELSRLRKSKDRAKLLSNRDELIRKLSQQRINEIIPLKIMELSDTDEDVEGENPVMNSVGAYISGLFSFNRIVQSGGDKVVDSGLIQLTRTVQLISDAEDKIGGNILSLITIKNCENYLLTHSMNVCVLSMVIGKKLGLNREELCDLSLGALVHDIGKFQNVHQDDTDYTNHPYESFKFIISQEEPSKSMILKAFIALDHHISFDGKRGFPSFRIGHIPHLFSRIVAVCDAYDCLTTPASHSDTEAMLPDVALRIILKKSGEIFDPVVSRLFVETLGKYPIGSVVEIDNGDIGIVVESGKGAHRLLRPKVLIIKDRYGNEMTDRVIYDLSERHPRRKAYLHSIVCSHIPARVGINVSGYLLDYLTDLHSHGKIG